MNPPPTAVVGTAPAGANAPVSPDVVVHDPRRKRLILAAMCTALMGVVASVSGLNVAQQDLAREFGASQGAILWMINGYTVALASLLMPFGAIGDRWGRKPVLVSGLGLFFLSSVGSRKRSEPRRSASGRASPVAAGSSAFSCRRSWSTW